MGFGIVCKKLYIKNWTLKEKCDNILQFRKIIWSHFIWQKNLLQKKSHHSNTRLVQLFLLTFAIFVILDKTFETVICDSQDHTRIITLNIC